MIGQELDHASLAELLERGQQSIAVVDNIVIFYNRIWNYTKCSQRSAGVAGIVITQDKDDKVERIYATQHC